MKYLKYWLSILFLLTVTAFTQNANEIIDAAVVASVEKLQPGKSNQIAVQLTIYEPWHVNSNKPEEDFLIATEISFDQTEAVTFGRINYPEPEIKTFAFSDNPLPVFAGTVHAFTTITIPPDYQGESVAINGSVYYQACNDESCLAPDEITFSAEFPLADANESVTEINQELFSKMDEPVQVESEGNLASVIESQGLIVAFLLIFVGGLALNLTPCVYPLIPITISYFGGQVGGKKGSVALYGIVYVLGMSITYSVLGVFFFLPEAF